MNEMSKSSFRKATNVSLDGDLVSQARELGINLSRACEAGLADAVKRERIVRFKAENAEAFASYNEHVEKYGLPLAKYRMF